jgi:hypothetical protein
VIYGRRSAAGEAVHAFGQCGAWRLSRDVVRCGLLAVVVGDEGTPSGFTGPYSPSLIRA